MNYTVLAIDQSISCSGWAAFSLQTEELLGSGYIDLPARKFNSQIERMLALEEAIKKIIHEYPVVVICVMEGYSFGSKMDANKTQLYEACGILKRLIYKHTNMEVVHIAPQSVKKAITGHGRADKAEVARIISERFNKSFVGDTKAETNRLENESDAIAIGLSFFSKPIASEIKQQLNQ